MTINTGTRTRIGAEIKSFMESQDPQLSTRELAAKVGCTQEYARRVVAPFRSGEKPTIPSPNYLYKLGQVLGIDVEALERLAALDRLDVHLRNAPADAVQHVKPVDPEVERISRAWPFLSEAEKDSLLLQVRSFVQGREMESAKNGGNQRV